MDADAEGGRWAALFADLEGQFEAADAAELAAEVAERSRQEFAQSLLLDRVRGAVGGRAVLALLGVGVVHGTWAGCGPDWVLVREEAGSELLGVPAALLWVRDLPRAAAAVSSGGMVAARWHLRLALRALARERVRVRLILTDGTTLGGTLDRVGRDYVELAEHPADEPRRAAAVTAISLVPLVALAAVRRR